MARPADFNPARLHVAVAAVAVALVIGVWLMRGEPSRRPAPIAPSAAASVSRLPALTAEEREARRQQRRAAASAREADASPAPLDPMTRYPPWSQPLRQDDAAAMPDHSRPRLRALDLRTGAAAKVQLKLTQTRSHVSFGERASVTLEATLDGAPAKLEIVSANLQKLGGTPGELPPTVTGVDFRDDGRAPDARARDGAHSAWVPFDSAELEGFRGEVALGVTATAAGEQGYIGYRFVLGGPAPARFTGRVREGIEDGSLVLRLEVQVSEPGWYHFAGRLCDSEGRPVAFMTDRQRLELGKPEARLVAYGALLREGGASSPYELRDVEGSLIEASGAERALEPRTLPYRTRKYALETFSTKLYQPNGRVGSQADEPGRDP